MTKDEARDFRISLHFSSISIGRPTVCRIDDEMYNEIENIISSATEKSKEEPELIIDIEKDSPRLYMNQSFPTIGFGYYLEN